MVICALPRSGPGRLLHSTAACAPPHGALLPRNGSLTTTAEFP
jgi:hypothetical protein